MLIDQIDNILRGDGQFQQAMGFQAVKSPKFYPSSQQLWTEMPVEIIRTAAEEHEECMKRENTKASKTHGCWKDIITQKPQCNMFNYISFSEGSPKYK